jgi:hypothetical protein
MNAKTCHEALLASLPPNLLHFGEHLLKLKALILLVRVLLLLR